MNRELEKVMRRAFHEVHELGKRAQDGHAHRGLHAGGGPGGRGHPPARPVPVDRGRLPRSPPAVQWCGSPVRDPRREGARDRPRPHADPAGRRGPARPRRSAACWPRTSLADHDMPPFDRAAMDGYAVRAADVAAAPVVLEVAGQIRAGQCPTAPLRAGPGRAGDDGRARARRAPPRCSRWRRRARSTAAAASRSWRRSEPGAHIARQGCGGAAPATSCSRAGDDRSIPPPWPCWPRSARAACAWAGGPRSPCWSPATSWWTSGTRPAAARIRNSNGYAVAAQAALGGRGRALAGRRARPGGPHRGGGARGLRARTCWSSRAACRRAPSTWSRRCWRASTSGLLFTRVAIKPGRAAGLRPPRRQAGVRPARQPRLGAGHLRRCSCARRCCACRARAW